MPIYEYACSSCKHTLDALQKMSEDALVDCPECGEPKLKRLISAPNFRLKGGGWYETDFKKDKQRNVHKSDSESGSSSKKDGKDSSSSSDGKSDGKSAGKADSTASSKSSDSKSASD